MFRFAGVRRQIPLKIRTDGGGALGGAGDPEIGDPAMSQGIYRLVGVSETDRIAQLVAEQVARSAGASAI